MSALGAPFTARRSSRERPGDVKKLQDWLEQRIIDNAVRDHHVHASCLERYILDVAQLETLERSIADVFIPNRNLLLSLLKAASTKWQLPSSSSRTFDRRCFRPVVRQEGFTCPRIG
jgi:hypothetical protein